MEQQEIEIDEPNQPIQPRAISELFSDTFSMMKENYFTVWMIILALITLIYLFKRYQQYVEAKPVKYGKK